MKNFFKLNTIFSKIVFTFAVFSLTLLIFVNYIVSSSVAVMEENLISQRLRADINYVEDIISPDKAAVWSVKDGSIYYGDILIGDGTPEKANLEPFYDHKDKTGTFAYVFMLDDKAVLGYVPGTGVAEGYEEGHYLRVAGSTKGPDGSSIVGTYITKNVSDELDRNGIYFGEAIVAGGRIFCLYRTLKNADDEVVGAIVVGRNIEELKSQMGVYARRISFVIIIMVLMGLFIISLFMKKWLNSIAVITSYIKEIEGGNIPEQRLKVSSKDETSLISDSINKMVDSLKENVILKRKSETDPLTGMPNRFAYESYSKYLQSKTKLNPRTLTVEILDIDYFKEYNDNYGHSVGDKCLETVSGEIQQLFSNVENVFACRYGGDEFVIIYDGFSVEEVESYIIKLKERIAGCNIEHRYSKISDVVTITQGAYFGTFNQEYTVKDFLEKADAAMYEVKKTGRNSYNLVNSWSLDK